MSDSAWRRLRRTWRPTVGDDVDDEVAFHFAMRVDEFMAAGMTRDAAERAARERFGDVANVRSELVSIGSRHRRRMDAREHLDALRQDLVVSVRALRREPLFAAGVVITLGLGIGANATMFGVVDRLMLRGPAHVANARDVDRLYVTAPEDGKPLATSSSVGYVTYAALRDHARSFAGVGAYQAAGAGRFGAGAQARPIQQASATWDLFTTLGVRPVLGRFYSRDEDSPPRGAKVVVISEELWQSEYGGVASVLGQRIELNDESYTIVGVAPRGFTNPELARVDVWLPITLQSPVSDWPTSYRAQWMRVVTRLAPGVSAERASGEATRILRAAYTGSDTNYRRVVASVRPLWYNRAGAPSLVASVSRWLMGVAVVVLLVTCANVANLLIARARRRRREIAVRLALGAGRQRVVRLLVVETLLIVLGGGLAAIGVALAGGRVMRASLLSDVAWNDSGVDARVFVFTFGLAIVTGLVVGLAPALDATRANLTSALKAGGGEGGGRRSRGRTALTILQASLCVVLLIGAGLFVESLFRSRAVDLGFQPSRVLRASPRYSLRDLTGDARREALRRSNVALSSSVALLRTMPWVEHAALSVGSPFGNGYSGIALKVPGRDSLPASVLHNASITAASADYFATFGTPLRAGRVFTAADRDGSAPVVIVNETMARTLWPGERVLGRCIEIGDPPAPCASVVGIVADVHRNGLREPAELQYYVPFGQERGIGGTTILVRPRGDAEAALSKLRQALVAVPEMPYTQIELMEAVLDPQYRPWRLGAAMFGVFGLLALVIAGVGLYSVIAYLVADRTRELGIRIALGATDGRIVREVVASGVAVTAVGVTIGIAVALLAAGYIQPLLFDMPARDPAVVLVVALLVLAIGAVAAWRPARRAASVDPMVALRVE
jgi:predicted permease